MNSTRSWIKLLSTSCIGLLCALAFGQAAATTGAVNTTDDPGFPETTYTDQPCTNGPTHTTPEINCNQYLDKRDVWLSGLAPKPSQLGVGTYFFAVLVPGTQSDPNDGTVGNLSTSDTYLARTFTVDSDGVISNWGSHLFDSVNDIIQLAPYDNTTNPGGVYILAVCQYTGIAGTGPLPGVNPSTCKYDAFKVVASACTSGDPSCCTGDGCQQPPPPLPLAIPKDATGAYTDTFTWQIAKSVDKTIVNIINDRSAATATFNY